METKYCISRDEEYFEGECDTREQAIKEGEVLHEGVPFWTGIVDPITLEELSRDHAERIVEDMEQHAFERCGDVAEDYLKDVTGDQVRELDKELSAVIQKWLKRHGHEPNFHAVEDIQKHDEHLKTNSKEER